MENKLSNLNNSTISINSFGYKIGKINYDRYSDRGIIPQYNHIKGGICFKSRGQKFITIYQKVSH